MPACSNARIIHRSERYIVAGNINTYVVITDVSADVSYEIITSRLKSLRNKLHLFSKKDCKDMFISFVLIGAKRFIS